jgi:hypothetical protein
MVGVPNPTRFLVAAACSTVSGTVRQVRRDPADGEGQPGCCGGPDVRPVLILSQPGAAAGGRRPRDVPRLTIPRPGQRATFYGAWVLDRNQGNQAAMHPVWMVEAASASASAGAGVAAVPMLGAGSRTVAAKRLQVQLRHLGRVTLVALEYPGSFRLWL